MDQLLPTKIFLPVRLSKHDVYVYLELVSLRIGWSLAKVLNYYE